MNLTFIGFGHMGSAIASGAVRAEVLKPGDIRVCDKSAEAKEHAKSLGISVFDDYGAALSGTDAVILAVRPADLADLAKEIAVLIPQNAIICSIIAGKKISTLEGLFGSRKIIRIMPNTPAMVGEGMTGICGNEMVSREEILGIARIFESFGRAEVLDESLFDAVTAVSGSGPAYVYAFIIALKKYAVEAGMSEAQAEIFAAQTVLGSAKMVLESGTPAETLKKNICTPNGTTVEAVKVLDERGFEGILIDAARACERRSKELGK